MGEKAKIKWGIRSINGTRMVIWQYLNGFAVNEYTGYCRDTVITIYPGRMLMPSSLAMTKRQISLYDTVREY